MTSKQYEAICESLTDTVIHLSQLAQKGTADRAELEALSNIAAVLMS